MISFSEERQFSEEQEESSLINGQGKPPFRASNKCSLISHSWKVALFFKQTQPCHMLPVWEKITIEESLTSFPTRPALSGQSLTCPIFKSAVYFSLGFCFLPVILVNLQDLITAAQPIPIISSQKFSPRRIQQAWQASSLSVNRCWTC